MENYSHNYSSTKTLSILSMAGIVLVALCDLGGATIGIGQVVKPEAILHLEDGKQLSIWMFFQSLLILISITGRLGQTITLKRLLHNF